MEEDTGSKKHPTTRTAAKVARLNRAECRPRDRQRADMGVAARPAPSPELGRSSATSAVRRQHWKKELRCEPTSRAAAMHDRARRQGGGKNMNSLRAVEKAIGTSRPPVARAREGGRGFVQETLSLGTPTRGTRGSSAARSRRDDYRYFPDPDLPPLTGLGGASRRGGRARCRDARRTAVASFVGRAQAPRGTKYDCQRCSRRRRASPPMSRPSSTRTNAKAASNWVMATCAPW